MAETTHEQQEHEGETENGRPQAPQPSRDADVWQTEFYLDIGLRIQYARKHRGMTQDEMAKELGVSRPTCANIETGRQRVPVDRLWKLAVILGVPVSTLIPAPMRSA